MVWLVTLMSMGAVAVRKKAVFVRHGVDPDSYPKEKRTTWTGVWSVNVLCAR
jgi:hypothetical protein